MGNATARWDVAVDGGRVAVLGEGSSAGTLVVVPGVMSDAEGWADVVRSLPDHPSVVVNRRGRPGSSPLGEGYSVAVEVADLHAVLDAVPGPKDVLGWSYGGLIATETAVDRDDVRSLLLYEPVAGPFAEHVTDALQAAARAEDLDRLVEIVNVEIAGYGRDHVRALRELPAWSHLRTLARPMAAEHAALNAFAPSYARYRDLEVPVGILAGTLSAAPGAPYADAVARFVAALPQARLRWMEGLSHLAHVEAPAALADHVRTVHEQLRSESKPTAQSMSLTDRSGTP